MTRFVLALIAMFMIKHMLFDFAFQTPYMFMNKGIFGHPGGILHAGLHIIGSLAAMMIAMLLYGPAGAAATVIVKLLAIEFVIHYMMDYVKMNTERILGLTVAKPQYWWLFGFDQMVHHLTYVYMGSVLVTL